MSLPRLLVVLATLLATRAAAEEPGACSPWPGEPSPLPTLESPDAVLSRWAALRIGELGAEARMAEASAPARASRLWRHLLCLDPANTEAAQAAERTRVVRVHRPEVVIGRSTSDPKPTPALSSLDAPIRIVSVPRAPMSASVPPAATSLAVPQPAPTPDWGRADAALASAEAQLHEANFEAALAAADRLRRQLRSVATVQGVQERQARAEVVAATAQIALGHEEAARQSFERALVADPALRLDPATTSPKVRRAFDAALGAKGGKP